MHDVLSGSSTCSPPQSGWAARSRWSSRACRRSGRSRGPSAAARCACSAGAGGRGGGVDGASLVLTGIWLADEHGALNATALLHTDFGRVVLVKALLVAVLIGGALLHDFVLGPRLAREIRPPACRSGRARASSRSAGRTSRSPSRCRCSAACSSPCWNDVVDASARHLRLLTETIAAVNSSLDLQEVLGLVARNVADALQADACFVYLYDERADELVLRATHGTRVEDMTGRPRMRPGEGITGTAAAERAPVMIASRPTSTRASSSFRTCRGRVRVDPGGSDPDPRRGARRGIVPAGDHSGRRVITRISAAVLALLRDGRRDDADDNGLARRIRGTCDGLRGGRLPVPPSHFVQQDRGLGVRRVDPAGARGDLLVLRQPAGGTHDKRWLRGCEYRVFGTQRHLGDGAGRDGRASNHFHHGLWLGRLLVGCLSSSRRTTTISISGSTSASWVWLAAATWCSRALAARDAPACRRRRHIAGS